MRLASSLITGILPLLWACTTAPKGADSGAGGADGGGAGAGAGGDGADGGAQDSDGDGFVSDDCAPDDAAAFPGAPERCNGEDDDCDGALGAWEEDAEGDGALDCAACEAAGLYGAVQGLTEVSALNAILDEAVAETRCEYWRSQDLMYLSLDLREDTTVECVYTGVRVAIRGGEPEGGALNVEHTWPQSEGADTEPARCDLHHLYPAQVEANERRGNLPFGEVSSGTTWSEGGSSAGRDSGGRTVFEPRDAHKGNVARSLLYVGLRYGRSLQSGEQALFLRWHQADPVTAADQARDAGIADEQGSPNPYVACPGLVERILGG